jgi:hypothetical protein
MRNSTLEGDPYSELFDDIAPKCRAPGQVCLSKSLRLSGEVAVDGIYNNDIEVNENYERGDQTCWCKSEM